MLRKSQKELVGKLDERLSSYLEDYPNATEADLVQAFGPAEEVAHSLNQELPPRKVKQFRTKKIVIRVVAGILAALLLGLTAYVYFEKEKPLRFDDEIKIIDRTQNVQTP